MCIIKGNPNIYKLNPINDFLKVMKIRYYKEISLYINKYFEGEYDKYEFIDNEIILNSLNITQIKASKILSNLNKYKIDNIQIMKYLFIKRI